MLIKHPMTNKCGLTLGMCALILLMTLVLGARPAIYTLVERVRMASVIAIVKVDALEPGSIKVSVIKLIKGEVPQTTTQMKWNRKDTTEFVAPRYRIDEQVLIFANPDGSMLKPLGDGSSDISAEKENLEQFERSIEQIIRFDHSDGDGTRKAILEEMLEPHAASSSNEAALTLMLRDIDYKTFPADELIQPLVRLTKSTQRKISVPGTQVLGRIRSKAIMPPLFELLAASDVYVSETAASLVKERTGLAVDFNSHAPDKERAAEAKKWIQWWEKNKEKVDLRF